MLAASGTALDPDPETRTRAKHRLLAALADGRSLGPLRAAERPFSGGRRAPHLRRRDLRPGCGRLPPHVEARCRMRWRGVQRGGAGVAGELVAAQEVGDVADDAKDRRGGRSWRRCLRTPAPAGADAPRCGWRPGWRWPAILVPSKATVPSDTIPSSAASTSDSVSRVGQRGLVVLAEPGQHGVVGHVLRADHPERHIGVAQPLDPPRRGLARAPSHRRTASTACPGRSRAGPPRPASPAHETRWYPAA